MMRIWFVVIFIAFISSILRPGISLAQSTDLKASVGNYYFTVSGYNSPFASIVLSSNSVFMASAVADKKGYFTMKNVLINEGFSNFCFEAIDVRRVGDSFTCIEIPPATGDLVKDNIFLPPTVGLSGKKLTPGSAITASGYSMPNAKVILNISKDIILEASSDSSGYYKIEIMDIPSGKYNLYGTAVFESKDSEIPSRKILIESVSTGDLLRDKLVIILITVFVVLLIIILLLILLSKRIRKWLKGTGGKKIGKSKKRPLHHEWMFGY